MTADEAQDGTRFCTHCGAVLEVGRLVRLNESGEYEYACEACAVEVRR